VALVLIGAVADFAESVEEYGAAERIWLLTLVEADVATTTQLGVLQPLVMKIQTGSHSITLDRLALPSVDDMNHIIGSVTRTPEEFQQLSKDSTAWPANFNCAQFLHTCKQWMEKYAKR
jgi:hypothetical protein